ncbi:MAG: maltodextrin phosphorylase [Nitrospira bacterium SM23_35]|nr:MAG: maltodextrin phosphorylase [Nitrospira bacterium SM23_35]
MFACVVCCSGLVVQSPHNRLSVKPMKQSILENLRSRVAKLPQNATPNDWYLALSFAVRDRMMQQWIDSLQNYTEDIPVVAYLSAEFLLGPQLRNILVNLGMYDEAFDAAKELGIRLADLLQQEEEPGLGNGGKGGIAACTMDSLSTLEVPAIAYGVRYEFGSFKQEIRDGWQVEMTDAWLASGSPWEILRPEIAYEIKLGGSTESYYDEQDCFRVRWIPKFSVKGTAYDSPVTGYKGGMTNLLRLWKAEAIESFDFEALKTGDYFGALNEKIASQSVSKILYPDDEPYAGKQLRLAQQYFFVSCALQDMIRLHLLRWKPIHSFSDSFAVHLNDTPPAVAVAELMRLLVDEHLVSWDKAWYITQNTFTHTNHTMLFEALEKWPVQLFAGILPRHLEIIYEINRRFLDEICLMYPNNNEELSRFSLIDENDQKYVRMSHLAALGGRAINGVSNMQSDLLKKTLFPEFYGLYPERFFQVTNGVSPRRWIVACNPCLSGLITGTIGDRWIDDLQEIQQLETYASDPALIQKWQEMKRENKAGLGSIIREKTGISVDPGTLFDIQIKRLHESNRQHLNLLHILTLFNRVKKSPQTDITPRTFIFGGKASPGYFLAQLILKLINSAAGIINNDPDVAGRLKVVFIPDLNMKNYQNICPAADLSEQIATAGREASGTGSMKLAMNGALTVGSMNGTTLEIAADVGNENLFLFGLTAEEVAAAKSHGYNPMDSYRAHAELKEVIDLIGSGIFLKQDATLFKPLLDSLLNRDEYMVLADYQSYIDCQNRVSAAFGDQKKWTQMSILTVARMGRFSSDRAVREYCEKIWHVAPLKRDSENM